MGGLGREYGDVGEEGGWWGVSRKYAVLGAWILGRKKVELFMRVLKAMLSDSEMSD